jgi:hypothetical protein
MFYSGRGELLHAAISFCTSKLILLIEYHE